LYENIEIHKTKSAYWVIGYISVFGGPFGTEEQARKYREDLIKKWLTQEKY
tara:strand:+ start:5290 stop:5442 length:153 start_codon:yes stop_codon:yes gene_type:complete